MKLTTTLLGFLNRVFNKDPAQFLALRITYDGASLTWQVQDQVLTTSVVGGSGQNLAIDLTQFSVLQLAQFITVQPGYDVPFVDGSTLNQLSAMALIDSSGDVSQSNGDHLYGYTSTLWAYMEAVAPELVLAEKQIEAMPAEMSIPTADGFWLDYLCGTVYGFPRGVVINGGVSSPEPDNLYAPRVIQSILAARGNNIGIEIAIEGATGQPTTVTDAPINGPGFPLFDGVIQYDGSHQYNSSATRLYGLFDVNVGYDLLGGSDPAGFTITVLGMLDAFRDAGTHLRQFTLKASALTDTLPAIPADGLNSLVVSPALADTLATPTDGMSLAAAMTFSETLTPTERDSFGIAYTTVWNGARVFDGSVRFASGHTVTEVL